MRFLLGVIFGALLTVGIAFVADSYVTTDAAADTTTRRIVNWDVAEERLRVFTTAVRTGWDRLEREINGLT